MSRKKILSPLAKRHTHHRTLALGGHRLAGVSEGSSLLPRPSFPNRNRPRARPRPRFFPVAVLLVRLISELCSVSQSTRSRAARIEDEDELRGRLRFRNKKADLRAGEIVRRKVTLQRESRKGDKSRDRTLVRFSFASEQVSPEFVYNA